MSGSPAHCARRLARCFASLATVMVLFATSTLLAGCKQATESSTPDPLPAFSGEMYERTADAMAGRDELAIPTALVTQEYAMPDGCASYWDYLYASPKSGKYFTAVNYSTITSVELYAPCTWNAEDWEDAPSDVTALVKVDADEAYHAILNTYPELADQPYRISFMSYQSEIEMLDDAPEPMTWYFYFTTTEKLDRFAPEVENPNDIATATVLVSAKTGNAVYLE